MKVLYLSVPPFFDVDLSLISHLSKLVDVYYLIDMPPHYQKASAFEVKSHKNKAGIYNAVHFEELYKFSKYIPLDKFYIINRLSSKTYSLSNIKLQKEIKDFINLINPDIIHSGHFVHEYLYYFLFTNKRKIILTVHDPFPHYGEFTRRKNFNRIINYLFIKRIILLNKTQKAEFLKKNKNKFIQVYNSQIGIYEYLRDYSVGKKEDDKFRILFFGRISPYKGLHILLNAFKKLQIQYANTELIIAGSGKFDFDITEFKATESIRFINRYIPNEELVFLMSQSSIVVCPYLDATQSGVVMSAYALYKPVLATRVGGLPEMIEDNHTGFLVAPNNVDELSEKMAFIIQNKEMINNIEKNIMTEYDSGEKSWDHICKRLVEIYKNAYKK